MPRLIYADWLEENDEEGKAEYLRLVTHLRDHVDDEVPLKRLLELARRCRRIGVKRWVVALKFISRSATWPGCPES